MYADPKASRPRRRRLENETDESEAWEVLERFRPDLLLQGQSRANSPVTQTPFVIRRVLVVVEQLEDEGTWPNFG